MLCVCVNMNEIFDIASGGDVDILIIRRSLWEQSGSGVNIGLRLNIGQMMNQFNLVFD